ncbi:MAG: hypothetical protein M0R46_13265 [Candidatus Muirbacterium halophilum]|nr:hypothetical protein [Candidatus Muirbacterium halophilum]
MIDEKYLQMAITIRRTYLKLLANNQLYESKLQQIVAKFDDTIEKLELLKTEKNKPTETLNKLLAILSDIEEEGKRMEKIIDPINIEIEKLAKEEQVLYQKIVDDYPKLNTEQIVEIVQNRLINEGLS